MYSAKTPYLKVKRNSKVQPNSSNLEQEICSNKHDQIFKQCTMNSSNIEQPIAQTKA
jgi:hypothetical protein